MEEVFLSVINNPDWWLEIERQYNAEGRHYHNMSHLENMYVQLQDLKSEIQDWESVIIALFYHDAVYDVLRHDNEEQSAELAVKRMSEQGFSADKIEKVKKHILATKGHQISDDADTNLFTDIDLSILAAPAETYMRYSRQIRAEYDVYPDELYYPGRQKVLQHFIAMPCLFKTRYFSDKENTAKLNLQMELENIFSV